MVVESEMIPYLAGTISSLHESLFTPKCVASDSLESHVWFTRLTFLPQVSYNEQRSCIREQSHRKSYGFT